MTGRIKNIIAEKSFGFIRCDSDNKDYFFHRDSTDNQFDNFQVGDNVEFESIKSDKGPRAEYVRKV